MKCTHPLYAIDYGLDPLTGKRKVKLAPQRPDAYSYENLLKIHGKNLLVLPCGSCLACKVNHAKEWSIRCMLEASLYTDNWFLTLTYDDAHLPSDHKVNVVDVQLFLKSLRKKIPGVRFLCSAEYGETTKRPHYHLILFNCKIPDLKCVSHGRLGGFYFDSKFISSIWSKGQITIGEVTPNSCEYVARYCLKKVNGDEFITMSLKPGLGGQYALDHLNTIYDTDGVYLHGKKYKVPRYFDKILEKVDPSLFSLVKKNRVLDNFGAYKRNLLISSYDGLTDEEIFSRQSRLNLEKEKARKRGVL